MVVEKPRENKTKQITNNITYVSFSLLLSLFLFLFSLFSFLFSLFSFLFPLSLLLPVIFQALGRRSCIRSPTETPRICVVGGGGGEEGGGEGGGVEGGGVEGGGGSPPTLSLVLALSLPRGTPSRLILRWWW